MADYHGAARSNYFKVKDRAALEADLEESFGGAVEIGEGTPDREPEQKGRICLLTAELSGLWPDYEDWSEEREVWDVVAPHLADGEVAVFVEIGFEKLRVVAGKAIAINSKGETETLDLRDIADKAAHLGDVITQFHY